MSQGKHLTDEDDVILSDNSTVRWKRFRGQASQRMLLALQYLHGTEVNMVAFRERKAKSRLGESMLTEDSSFLQLLQSFLRPLGVGPMYMSANPVPHG